MCDNQNVSGIKDRELQYLAKEFNSKLEKLEQQFAALIKQQKQPDANKQQQPQQKQSDPQSQKLDSRSLIMAALITGALIVFYYV